MTLSVDAGSPGTLCESFPLRSTAPEGRSWLEGLIDGARLARQRVIKGQLDGA